MTGVASTVLAILLVCGGPLTAQTEPALTSGTEAFLWEGLGASGASVVASGLYLAAFDEGACGDDLDCTFGALSGLAVVSSGASVLGVALAERLASTDGSLWGAAVGAVVGTAAGFLVASHWGDSNDFTRAPSLGLTQGTVAALGSRIGTMLRWRGQRA
jgi:hypothetical protein